MLEKTILQIVSICNSSKRNPTLFDVTNLLYLLCKEGMINEELKFTRTFKGVQSMDVTKTLIELEEKGLIKRDEGLGYVALKRARVSKKIKEAITELCTDSVELAKKVNAVSERPVGYTETCGAKR